MSKFVANLLMMFMDWDFLYRGPPIQVSPLSIIYSPMPMNRKI